MTIARRLELAEEWRGRAACLDVYARVCRRKGDPDGHANIAELTAINYRVAADELEGLAP